MTNVDWREKYRAKIKTADQALQILQPGDRLFIGSACGTPQKLVQALADCPTEDVEITHLLTLGVAPYAQEKLASRYRANAFFISANVRPAVWEGRADYTPIFLSEIPELLRSGRLPLDVGGQGQQLAHQLLDGARLHGAQLRVHIPEAGQGHLRAGAERADAVGLAHGLHQ